MKFGEKVRDLRKKNSLTQDELAKCLGVSKRTIIGWERDGRYPRNVEILEKMADIFHVPLTYLQPDQSLFIERAAEAYGKKGKIEAQHLASLCHPRKEITLWILHLFTKLLMNLS